MAIEFPADKFVNDTFDYGGMTYVWDGEKWTASGAAAFENAYVNKDGDTMTGDLTVPSLNGGPLAGLRNLLINGGANIDQRNAGFVSNTYGPDRWYTYSNNVQLSKSRITDLPGFTYALSVRNTGGATTPKAVSQAIELIDSSNTTTAPFVENGTYTLSWWCKQRDGSVVNASDITSVSFNFRDSITDNVNASTGLSSTAVEQIDSHGNWRKFATTVTIDQAANANNTCLTVRIGAYNGTELSSANGVFYTGLQLEPGSQPTPFEHRPIGTELALCQRYYLRGAGSGVGYVIETGSAVGGISLIPTPVEMRAAPTLIGDFKVYTSRPGSSTDILSVQTTGKTALGIVVSFTPLSDASRIRACRDIPSFDAEL